MTALKSEGLKALAAIMFVCGIFVFGASATENMTLRLLAGAPMILLMVSLMLFRKPSFIDEYFKHAADRDASRGLISIKNLGILVIIGACFAFYSVSQ